MKGSWSRRLVLPEGEGEVVILLAGSSKGPSEGCIDMKEKELSWVSWLETDWVVFLKE